MKAKATLKGVGSGNVIAAYAGGHACTQLRQRPVQRGDPGRYPPMQDVRENGKFIRAEEEEQDRMLFQTLPAPCTFSAAKSRSPPREAQRQELRSIGGYPAVQVDGCSAGEDRFR